jgi:penicillin-binding protein 1A
MTAPPSLASRLTRWWLSPRRRRNILVGAGAFVLFSSALLAGAWVRVCAGGACPSIAGLTNYDPDQASKLYAADGRLITDYGEQRRTVIPLKEMSPAVVAAFLAVEDRRFYRHHGIDWVRVFGAIKSTMLGHKQGFSTITMQLAGNLWPEQIDRRQRSGFKGITRKIREARMALEIERNYSKDKILELYLNQIELGPRAFGVEAVAQRYFGKSAKSLNVAEAAMLAALPKGPTVYNPRRRPGLAVQRRNFVISQMEDWNKLSHQSAEAWKAYPLALSSRSDFSGVAEYFVEYVRQILQARFGTDLYRAGYRIFTSLDLDMQLSSERAMEAQLEAIEDGSLGPYRHQTYRQYIDQKTETSADTDSGPFSPYLQGLMVTLDTSGYIRALVGGRDFEDSKWNRVTQAQRQAGSTFKPIVYSAAIRAGMPLSAIIEDSPVSVEIPGQTTWEPKNYDSKFEGPMTLREALYHSRNTVAVKVGLRLGEDAVVSEASTLGISTRIPRVPSIFIGSADVVPLELIAAYTAFAKLGVLATPQAILWVEDRQGQIVWKPEVKETRVMDPAHAWLILDALRDVVRQPTGTAHGAVVGRGRFSLPAGGKTGTTNDGMDVWFIGFTPDLVTGVWMGFDKKTVIKGNAQGGLLAAPAWATMMRETYERRRAPAPWSMPDGVLSLDIDKSTGYLATPFCPRELVIREFYFPGTEPTERCPLHSPFRGGK